MTTRGYRLVLLYFQLVSAIAIFLSLNVANCEVNIEVNVSDMILLSFSEVYVTVLSSSDLSINLVVFDLVESYFSLFFFVF